MNRTLKILSFIFDLLVVVSFLALVILPPFFGNSQEINLADFLAPASSKHWLGTDNLGRDVIARLSDAVRGGVFPLWEGVLVGSLWGIVLGVALLAYADLKAIRWLSRLLRGVGAFLVSIPVGILAFGLAAYFEQAGLRSVIVALSMIFGIRMLLSLNDLFLQDQKLGYWQAHEALGGTKLKRIMDYGIYGGWKWVLLGMLVFSLRAAVAIEASLSYLGFGIQEPQASFGNILASHFDVYLKGHWQILFWTLGALMLTAAFPACLYGVLERVFRDSSFYRPKKPS